MFKLRRKTGSNQSSTKKVKRIELQTLGRLLFLSGVLLVCITPTAQYRTNTQLSYAYESPQQTQIPEEIEDPIEVDQRLFTGNQDEESKPRRVLIPSLKLDVAIKDAKVVRGKWEVFEDIASYGIGSGLPGRADNSVIFAHARRGLFLPLREIKKDAEILVFTKEKWFAYKVTEIKEVTPSEISVIAPTEEETLTLYTCSGFADTKRLIVVAKRLV